MVKENLSDPVGFMSEKTKARVTLPGGVGCGIQPTRKSEISQKSPSFIPFYEELGDVRPSPAMFGPT